MEARWGSVDWLVFVLMGPWSGWAVTLTAVVVLAGCHHCHHHVGGGCGGRCC